MALRLKVMAYTPPGHDATTSRPVGASLRPGSTLMQTVCAHHGCPALVDGKYCDLHRPRRLSFRRRGYGAAWDRARRVYLAGHPRCARCSAAARHVHHRDGRGPLGPRGLDPTNFEALCASCHNRHTRLDRVV